jgi:hypothetical protein
MTEMYAPDMEPVIPSMIVFVMNSIAEFSAKQQPAITYLVLTRLYAPRMGPVGPKISALVKSTIAEIIAN